MSIGPVEIIIVLALALLILGPKRLPSAGRSLGQGVREFKEGITMSSAEPVADAEVVERKHA